MKTIYFLILTFISLHFTAQELKTLDYDTLTISGVYKGKNLFVKNPFSPIEDQGFSVKYILLDNEDIHAEVNQSAVEIKLSERDRKIGQDLNLIIIYLKGTKPKILNFEDIK